jgi:hypothetical protein
VCRGLSGPEGKFATHSSHQRLRSRGQKRGMAVHEMMCPKEARTKSARAQCYVCIRRCKNQCGQDPQPCFQVCTTQPSRLAACRSRCHVAARPGKNRVPPHPRKKKPRHNLIHSSVLTSHVMLRARHVDSAYSAQSQSCRLAMSAG